MQASSSYEPAVESGDFCPSSDAYQPARDQESNTENHDELHDRTAALISINCQTAVLTDLDEANREGDNDLEEKKENGTDHIITGDSTSEKHPTDEEISPPDNLSQLELNLKDLRILKRVGRGDIGTVYLAEIRQWEEQRFAVKVMNKEEMKLRKKIGRANTEKQILKILDHPFVCRLYGVIETEKWLCLLTEFCPGGDLHIRRQMQPQMRFSESAVRFYVSEVVVALEYVHLMGIAYRDLKPENILIKADGHIMLTDFDLSLKHHQKLQQSTSSTTIIPASPSPSTSGSSCILPSVSSCFRGKCKDCTSGSKEGEKEKKKKKKSFRNRSKASAALSKFTSEPTDLRSSSFVGTHEYLAPEVISGDGHGSAVDWWTLGVLMFELLYGKTPFVGITHELTMENISRRNLVFPTVPSISTAAKDLMKGLMVKDPRRRLGSVNGAVDIKRHPFFSGVNWALLRCVPPPFVPTSDDYETGNSDFQNDFEVFF